MVKKIISMDGHGTICMWQKIRCKNTPNIIFVKKLGCDDPADELCSFRKHQAIES